MKLTFVILFAFAIIFASCTKKEEVVKSEVPSTTTNLNQLKAAPKAGREFKDIDGVLDCVANPVACYAEDVVVTPTDLRYLDFTGHISHGTEHLYFDEDGENLFPYMYYTYWEDFLAIAQDSDYKLLKIRNKTSGIDYYVCVEDSMTIGDYDVGEEEFTLTINLDN